MLRSQSPRRPTRLSAAEANLDHARQQLDIVASAANAESVTAQATASVESSADADDGERLMSRAHRGAPAVDQTRS
jgi:hypothetical protein